jgi:formylglycine-generating enzyme required for sulfatase activity
MMIGFPGIRCTMTEAFVSENAGRYRANYFDLHDMHGNVWEWTRSSYMPYPYSEDDGRNDLNNDLKKVARGGSWYDRPTGALPATGCPTALTRKCLMLGSE